VFTPSDDRICWPIVEVLDEDEVLVVDVVAVDAVDAVEELVADVVVMAVRTVPCGGA
jgi:hypothetical protein